MIQIVSDIHLEYFEDKEFRQFEKLVIPKADTLILAGDIGYVDTDIFNSFFDYVASKWVDIIYVTGNHEYYNDDIELVHTKIKKNLSKYDNVHFLCRDIIEIGNIRFIGGTLWTLLDPEKKELFNSKLNDLKKITANGELFDFDMYNKYHETDLQWLKDKIREYTINRDEKKLVVVTHHPPTMKFVNQKKTDYASTMCSDNEDLAEQCDLWVCGHTHTANSYKNIMINTACYHDNLWKINTGYVVCLRK